MAASDIKQTLETRAQQTLSATVNGRTATGHSLSEQIAAHRYLSSLEAVEEVPDGNNQVNFGLRTARIQPGGAA